MRRIITWRMIHNTINHGTSHPWPYSSITLFVNLIHIAISSVLDYIVEWSLCSFFSKVGKKQQNECEHRHNQNPRFGEAVYHKDIQYVIH